MSFLTLTFYHGVNVKRSRKCRKQHNAPHAPECPCPNPWNLTWQKRIKATGGIRVVGCLTST